MTRFDQFRAALPNAQQRMDKLLPRLEETRAKLRTISAEALTPRSGCLIDHHGNYRLDFMDRAYAITPDDFNVRRLEDWAEPSIFVQSIILTYLVTADGTPPIERWISFHDLPDGMFYEQAFRSYSGAELSRGLQGSLDEFRRAAKALQGESIAIGDAAYAFRVLPRLRLALVMWAGDEDFPAQARVLFEESAPHYLAVDGLAILGSQLVEQVLKAAKNS